MTSTQDNTDCIFCKIIAGSIPSRKVYEDDAYLGFLDVEAKTKGDSLLIPKEHHQWTYDVPDIGGFWEAARTLSRTLMRSLGAGWVNYFTYGHIPHAHIHILPRYGDIHEPKNNTIIPEPIQLSSDEMDAIAETVRKSS